MNHATEDQLLLLAYGELAQGEAGELEAHLATCVSCQTRLAQIETARATLEIAGPPRRPSATRWIAVGGGFAVAAMLAALWLSVESPPGTTDHKWRQTSQWSVTAGYVTASTLMDIDAQLTRLEQETSYGRP